MSGILTSLTSLPAFQEGVAFLQFHHLDFPLEKSCSGTILCSMRTSTNMGPLFHAISIALTLIASLASSRTCPGPEDSRVQTAITLETPSNGVSTTPDGRIFLLYARVDGSTGPQVVEYNSTTNTTSPYPDVSWNNYTQGSDPSTHLIRTNSQRIGPDGSLW